jgi:hypothetical protein
MRDLYASVFHARLPRCVATATGLLFALVLSGANALAQAPTPAAGSGGVSDAAALADKIANPIAAVIQVPFQFNYDRGMGRDQEGSMTYMKFQPVVPIEVSKEWNYIVRPIVPVQWMRNVDGFSGNGVGSIAIETFFSPITRSDVIWGLGPYVAFPSASGPEFGSKQWGIGASFAGIWRPGSWTMGALIYQSWNAGGSGMAGTANNTYWQPFISYVTKDAWTFTLDTESNYNWDAHRSSNPMNLIVSKLVFFDKLPVSFALGARYYLTSTPGGAEGWGTRATVSFVFPE